MEQTTETDRQPFSGVFMLPAGEPLLVRCEILQQLAALNGRSYRDIRAEFGVTGVHQTRYPAERTQDGMAVISVTGAITRYDGWCSSLFGGTSVAKVMGQLAEAVNDPSCRGICLLVDSPGGTAAGVSDLADMIFSAREQKPVVAYVDNQAASAGYWIASAAEEMIVSNAAYLGSIGVVLSVYTGVKADQLELVSSKSPKKRPDANQEEGRAQLQTLIDDLADVFIGSVARNRSVPVETVESDFGQGDMAIASKAVAAGMADSIGNLEAAMGRLKAMSEERRAIMLGSSTQRKGQSSMSGTQAEATVDPVATPLTAAEVQAQHPDAAQALVAQGAESERARIQAIEELDTVQARAVAGDLIDAAKFDGKTDARDLAIQIIKAQATAQAKVATNRTADAALIPVVTDAPAAAGTDDETQAFVASLGAALSKGNGKDGK